MFRLRRRYNPKPLLRSDLFNQNTFYERFLKDLGTARKRVLIESPFITTRRMSQLLPVLRELRRRGVSVTINTRDPEEHSPKYQIQADLAVVELHKMGVTIIYTGRHHRKLAIIDGQIMWEGSLNILSYNDSCEVMRRTVCPELCQQMLSFTGLNRYVVIQ